MCVYEGRVMSCAPYLVMPTSFKAVCSYRNMRERERCPMFDIGRLMYSRVVTLRDEPVEQRSYVGGKI